MQANPVISFEKVSFAYNGVPVLQDVDLVVNEREFLCIVGPNAGGKTTLLRLVLGLLKPASGRVRVFGQPPERARARIGYMPQQATLDPLFPVNVIDVVLMGRLGGTNRFGFYGKSDKEAAETALRQVQMYEPRRRPFSELSGGQRQRVLIARALASQPELLLLDEPMANIDAVLETELFDMLKRLNETIIIALVTHELGFVSRYVKSVACVNRRVVVHATGEITGQMIQEMYGRDVKMVLHDHRCAKEGHECSSS